MKTNWCRTLACLAGAGLGFGTLSGCQTWVAGMTLPSPRYLQHPPQYFPPSPPYPLPRELASQEATYAAPAPGVPAPAVPLPPALPAPGAPVPGAPAQLPPPVPAPAPPGGP
jgi:hypothetical protein